MTRQGRRTQFRALVVMGNGYGAAGFGVGKGPRPRQALLDAQKNCVKDIVIMKISPWGGLYHDVLGQHNNTKVMMRATKPLHGVTAGRVVAAICDCFGISNVTTKVIGRRNPFTVVNATFNALGQHETPLDVAFRRGRKFSDSSSPNQHVLSGVKV
jgi:small subunit ribosomal protein S5